MLNTAARLAILVSLPVGILAQLSGLRGTIPGSLHQCENTNLFFFDSDDSRPLTVLFLPSSEIPDSLRTGTITLEEAAQYNPLQVIQGIETPDAQEYDFTLGIAEGEAFEVFAFLEDGSGKALSLTRTVTTPLSGATSCLGDTQTTVSGLEAAVTSVTTTSRSSSTTQSSTLSTTRSTSTRSTSTTTAAMTATRVSDGTSLSSIPASSSSTGTGAASDNKIGTIGAVLVAGLAGVAGVAFAL